MEEKLGATLVHTTGDAPQNLSCTFLQLAGRQVCFEEATALTLSSVQTHTAPAGATATQGHPPGPRRCAKGLPRNSYFTPHPLLTRQCCYHPRSTEGSPRTKRQSNVFKVKEPATGEAGCKDRQSKEVAEALFKKATHSV